MPYTLLIPPRGGSGSDPARARGVVGVPGGPVLVLSGGVWGDPCPKSSRRRLMPYKGRWQPGSQSQESGLLFLFTVEKEINSEGMAGV